MELVVSRHYYFDETSSDIAIHLLYIDLGPVVGLSEFSCKILYNLENKLRFSTFEFEA